MKNKSLKNIFLSLLLTASLGFSLVACGPNKTDEKKTEEKKVSDSSENKKAPEKDEKQSSTSTSAEKTTTSSKDAESTSASKEKILIVLDWTPNTNHSGLFVAESEGYFKEAGLDVEIKDAPEGSTTGFVGAGKGQFGISFQDTLAAAWTAQDPVPVTAVAAILQHNTSGIISVKSKGITRPKEMEGHTYATWSNPVEQAILKNVIKNDGGDVSKVKFVPDVPENILQAIQGRDECIWAFYGWDGIVSKVKGPETNWFFFRDFGEQFDYYTPVLIANNDFLKKQPELAKKVIAAIVKGYTKAAQDPELAFQVMHKKLPEIDAASLHASQEWLSKNYIADAKAFGYIDPARWSRFYKWLNENKLLKSPIGEDFGFTNDFLPSAK